MLALLALASHPATELEMDELSKIVETLQATLGPDVEITLWHGGEVVLPYSSVCCWGMGSNNRFNTPPQNVCEHRYTIQKFIFKCFLISPTSTHSANEQLLDNAN